MTRRSPLVVLAALLAAAASPAFAGSTQVAVAADLTAPAKDIAAAFKAFLAFLKRAGSARDHREIPLQPQVNRNRRDCRQPCFNPFN